MITSPDNPKLRTVRRLSEARHRRRTGLFVAEGEDLVDAAARAGLEPELLLVAGVDVRQELLDEVSSLGSGTRVLGVYRQRYSDPGGHLSVYLHAVGDPGNVGTVVRSAHALCDGPVVLGPGCADPYGPKAVRASMGSIFARPPARAHASELGERLRATTIALDRAARAALGELGPTELAPPVVVWVGGEREGLPAELRAAADREASIPLRPDGPDSLNAAVAATLALYELGPKIADRRGADRAGAGGTATRMASHG